MIGYIYIYIYTEFRAICTTTTIFIYFSRINKAHLSHPGMYDLFRAIDQGSYIELSFQQYPLLLYPKQKCIHRAHFFSNLSISWSLVEMPRRISDRFSSSLSISPAKEVIM